MRTLTFQLSMGRIKTKLTKRVSNKIFKIKTDDVKDDFDANKAVVSNLVGLRSKKLRNTIAGYITRLKKNHKEY